jgi:hypothetical protein
VEGHLDYLQPRNQPLLLHTHRNGPFRPTTAFQMPSVGAAASPWMWTKVRSERGTLIRLCGDGVVSKRIENAQLYDQIRESQWKTIIDYAVEMQEFLREIQRQDHSSPAEPKISCKQNSQSRIPQNPRKTRKKKKKQILPPFPPQTLEPANTDQTQHFPTNGPTAKTRRDAPDFIRITTLVPEVQTQHPPNSEPIIRSILTKITPQSRRSPIPSPHTQPVQTDQAQHIPIIETLKPRRDAFDLTRDASAHVKTDQTRHTSETPISRRDAFDLTRDASAL